MHLYLISLLIISAVSLLTWIPGLAVYKIGILDIIPVIFRTAQKQIFGEGGNALGTFAFAFFIHALLQSQTIQSLFITKKKWLQKKGLFTIAIITILSSFAASSLSWYDELIHFYPLIVPLLLAMGFDIFGALLCLYGGSSAGQMSKISAEAMNHNFNASINNHPYLEGKAIKFTGADGIGFRTITWLILTVIVVFFNIWYCNKVFYESSTKILPVDNIEDNVGSSNFTKTKKIILFLFSFFIIGSILSQTENIANRWDNFKEKKGVREVIPSQITSSYAGETSYQNLGAIDKEGKTKIAMINEAEDEGFWGTFGRWEDQQLCYWFTIGAIIICLLSKQNIANTLVNSIKETIPLIIGYTLAFTPLIIIKSSGMNAKLSELTSSLGIIRNAKYLSLFGVFTISLIFGFFIPNSRSIFMHISVPLLYSISKNTLLYGTIIAYLGASLAMSFSPVNPILQISLQKNETSYKQYLKKTWQLWLILMLACLILIGIQASFLTKSNYNTYGKL